MSRETDCCAEPQEYQFFRPMAGCQLDSPENQRRSPCSKSLPVGERMLLPCCKWEPYGSLSTVGFEDPQDHLHRLPCLINAAEWLTMFADCGEQVLDGDHIPPGIASRERFGAIDALRGDLLPSLPTASRGPTAVRQQRNGRQVARGIIDDSLGPKDLEREPRWISRLPLSRGEEP